MVEPYQNFHSKRENDAIPSAYAYVPLPENAYYQPLPHLGEPQTYQNLDIPTDTQGHPSHSLSVNRSHPHENHVHHQNHSKSPTCGSVFLIIIGIAYFFLFLFLFTDSIPLFIIPAIYITSGVLGFTGEANIGITISIGLQLVLTSINALITIGAVVTALGPNDVSNSELCIISLIFGGLTICHVISLVQFFKTSR